MRSSPHSFTVWLVQEISLTNSFSPCVLCRFPPRTACAESPFARNRHFLWPFTKDTTPIIFLILDNLRVLTCDSDFQSFIGHSSCPLWGFAGGRSYFISRRNGRTSWGRTGVARGIIKSNYGSRCFMHLMRSTPLFRLE